MILAIDVGNSTTSVGLFNTEGRLTLRGRVSTNPNGTQDQCAMTLKGLFDLYGAELRKVTGVILSSVVPSITKNLCGAVIQLTGKTAMVMGPGVKTGLNIKSETHAQMGSDIIAGAVAALSDYPSPVIVIDMGTATTMSYMQGNVYEGCVILPGVRLSLEALSDHAAALPHISLEAPNQVFGHNTVDAMRSGVVFGNASMVDGMIDRLEAQGGPVATVVATGGSAPMILKHCKRNIYHDPDLLLRGLFLIHQKNAQTHPRKGA